MQIRLLCPYMHSVMDSAVYCKVLFCGAVYFYKKKLFFFLYKFLHLSCFFSCLLQFELVLSILKSMREARDMQAEMLARTK